MEFQPVLHLEEFEEPPIFPRRAIQPHPGFVSCKFDIHGLARPSFHAAALPAVAYPFPAWQKSPANILCPRGESLMNFFEVFVREHGDQSELD
jgi:hypothetical protein